MALEQGSNGTKGLERPRFSSVEAGSESPDTLNDDEMRFITAYRESVDEMLERIRVHPSIAQGVLHEMLRPDLWRILLNKNKADVVLGKLGEPAGDRRDRAQREADEWNREYDRKALAVQKAVEEFTLYVAKLNGRSDS
jgi:hypothetical protein